MGELIHLESAYYLDERGRTRSPKTSPDTPQAADPRGVLRRRVLGRRDVGIEMRSNW